MSSKVPIAAGCPFPPEAPCCGPDATKWIHKELDRHMAYAATTIPNELYLSGHDPAHGYAEFGAYLGELYPLMLYGLAVDYGFVDYVTLARISLNNQGSSITPNYSCTTNGREQTISVCGRCQNSTDYGNFILGAVIYAAAHSQVEAFASGVLFNLITGDFANVFGVDTQGVIAGYNYAQNHNGTFDHTEFCNALQSQGNGWYDPLKGNCAPQANVIRLNRPCCSATGGPNLDNAPQSIPNFDGFVSKSLPSEIEPSRYNSPSDRLRDMLLP